MSYVGLRKDSTRPYFVIPEVYKIPSLEKLQEMHYQTLQFTAITNGTHIFNLAF